MADPAKKQPENVPGRYYVDTDCDSCQICVNVAPDNFKMTDDDDHAFVFKQPENAEEKDACREALEGCPREAIGENGE